MRNTSWGLSSTQRQRQQRRRRAFIKTVVVLALLCGAGWLAYATGEELARVEVDVLQAELDSARSEIDRLRGENLTLSQAAETARQGEALWRERHDAEVPQGDLADLLRAAQDRIDAGVPVERLRFVVETVQAERNCENAPATKRFLVRTPLYRGANDAVVFAEGTITVTASGAAATNAAGQREAWFDPAEPVDIQLSQVGGAVTAVEGVLPLHFSLVRGSVEHLFSAQAGARGFLQVTEDRCAYP